MIKIYDGIGSTRNRVFGVVILDADIKLPRVVSSHRSAKQAHLCRQDWAGSNYVALVVKRDSGFMKIEKPVMIDVLGGDRYYNVSETGTGAMLTEFCSGLTCNINDLGLYFSQGVDELGKFSQAHYGH